MRASRKPSAKFKSGFLYVFNFLKSIYLLHNINFSTTIVMWYFTKIFLNIFEFFLLRWIFLNFFYSYFFNEFLSFIVFQISMFFKQVFKLYLFLINYHAYFIPYMH